MRDELKLEVRRRLVMVNNDLGEIQDRNTARDFDFHIRKALSNLRTAIRMMADERIATATVCKRCDTPLTAYDEACYTCGKEVREVVGE